MKCPHCGYENKEGARFCNLCQKSFVKDDTELGGLREPSELYGLAPLAEPSQEAKKAVETILRSQPTELNWSQRHLNWTWVLPQLFLIVAGMIVSYSLFMSTFVAIMAGKPFMLPFSGLVLFLGIIFPLLGVASIWGIGAWVLKRKNRSMWWLLIFLIPPAAYLLTADYFLNAFVVFAALVIEWTIFLRLENQSLPPPPLESPGSPTQPGSTIPPGLAPPGLGSRSDKYGP